MDAESRPKWERLGRLLAERRARLAPRYTVRKIFAGDVEVHPAVLRDIETAARDNFTASTLAAVEVAYQWAPGSIQDVLQGCDPTEVGPLVIPGPPGLGKTALAREAIRAMPAPAPRLPAWLASEIDRRGLSAETLSTAVENLRHLAAHSGYTLAELLLNAGLADEEDLVIEERPISEARAEALAEYDESARADTTSPFLSSRQRKRAEADAAARRKKNLKESP